VLLVPESDRPQLGEDEYHVVDLLGLEVFLLETGESIGVVTDVIPAGNDLLEVELHQQDKEEVKIQNSLFKIHSSKFPTPHSPLPTPPKKVLIPFVKAIAPIVDLETKRIEIAPPPGLLDL
jgi:16S rRNA processing protein RimM